MGCLFYVDFDVRVHRVRRARLPHPTPWKNKAIENGRQREGTDLTKNWDSWSTCERGFFLGWFLWARRAAGTTVRRGHPSQVSLVFSVLQKAAKSSSSPNLSTTHHCACQ